MGLFKELIDRWHGRHLLEVLDPLHGMKLQEFSVIDDDPGYLKHYFKVRTKKGKDEEFVVVFRPADQEAKYLRYLCTHHRKAGEEKYLTLSEGPWATAISHLVRLGQELPWDTSRKGVGGRQVPPERSFAKPSSVDQLFEQGHKYVEEQKLDDAIWSYSAALQLDPNRADIYFHRGVAHSNKYFNQGRNADEFQRTIDDYTRAIELNPNYGDAFFQRAGMYQQRGNVAKAIADYGEAIAYRHKLFSSHYARAHLWQTTGAYAKAFVDFDAAIKTEDKFDRAMALTGRGQLQHQLGKPDLAIADFTSALTCDPKMPGVYKYRATALRELGRVEEAIADLDKAISLTPNFAETSTHLAEVYNERGHCRKPTWSEGFGPAGF
jgi:Tfp pilus assembly protein PilF